MSIVGIVVLAVAVAQLQVGVGLAQALAFAVALVLGGLMIYCFWLILTDRGVLGRPDGPDRRDVRGRLPVRPLAGHDLPGLAALSR